MSERLLRFSAVLWAPLFLMATALSWIACSPETKQASGGNAGVEDGGDQDEDPGTGDGGTDGGSRDGAEPATGGVGTFLRVGFYNQHLAASANGSMHLVFREGAAERIFYARCDASCGDPASWSPVQLKSNAELGASTVGPYGVATDSTGRVHVLLGTNPSSLVDNTNRIVYATCAAGCTSAANWTFTDLASLIPNATVIGTSRTFMVEPSGRVSFLTGDNGVYYSCASGCTSLANWTATAQLNGGALHAAIDGNGVTHVMLLGGTTQGGDDLLKYARCASACNTASSWEISNLGFLTRTPAYAASLAVTTGGRVFMVSNEGTLSSPTPNDKKLVIHSCAGAGCMDLNTWTEFSLGAQDEGVKGAWIETSGPSALLATVRGFDLDLRECAAGCENASAWSAPVSADSSNAVNAAFPPATGSSCPSTAESANWWPFRPSVGISARGVVVVHNPYAIVKCPGNINPTQLPTIGRVISSF